MGRYIFLIFLIVSISFASSKDVIITKKIYPNISKNAIFEAAKMLFTLSNKENKNKDFIINSYRDKLEVEKIVFQNRIIGVSLLVDKWLLEVYEFENESRANLILIRRDALDLEDNKEIKIDNHNLFWDRLDYLLGLSTTWKSCESYFSSNLESTYCYNSLLTNKPSSDYISKNILISQKELKINTIDSIKADIFDETDLSIEKDNTIFEQSEDILDTNILSPIMEEKILEKKAEKIVEKKVNKNTEEPSENKIKDEMQNSDESIDKFKNEMKDIVNMKNSLNENDIKKIITESNELKENSEFSLETK
jgi:hypothetical protein